MFELPPQIITDRLILRPLVSGDKAQAIALLMSPEFMTYSPSGPLNEKSAETRFYELMDHFAENGFAKFAMLLRSTGELIGYCGAELCTIDGQETVEMGFRLEKHWRGRGFATEAAKAYLNWYDTHFADDVIAFTEPNNQASIHVLQKLGFVEVRASRYAKTDVIVFQRNDRLAGDKITDKRGTNVGGDMQC